VNNVRVVVSLGTYHLPFDRLVDWVDSWAAANPDVPVLLQHGVSKRAAHTANVEMIPHDELIELYTRAQVLVLQGGAGGVMDATSIGVVPLVVPRVPHLGEVIDDHQVQFATLLQEFGLVHLAQTEETLHHLLTLALSGELCTTRQGEHPVEGVQTMLSRLQALPPAALIGRPRWRRRLRRVGALVPRRHATRGRRITASESPGGSSPLHSRLTM